MPQKAVSHANLQGQYWAADLCSEKTLMAKSLFKASKSEDQELHVNRAGNQWNESQLDGTEDDIKSERMEVFSRKTASHRVLLKWRKSVEKITSLQLMSMLWCCAGAHARAVPVSAGCLQVSVSNTHSATGATGLDDVMFHVWKNAVTTGLDTTMRFHQCLVHLLQTSCPLLDF